MTERLEKGESQEPYKVEAWTIKGHACEVRWFQEEGGGPPISAEFFENGKKIAHPAGPSEKDVLDSATRVIQ